MTVSIITGFVTLSYQSAQAVSVKTGLPVIPPLTASIKCKINGRSIGTIANSVFVDVDVQGESGDPRGFIKFQQNQPIITETKWEPTTISLKPIDSGHTYFFKNLVEW
jgi:hypothetical protein